MKVSPIIKSCVCLLFCIGLACSVTAAERSPYMAGDVTKIFNMFDKFNPTKNYTIPPLED
jgi:hypothetical protein